MERINEIFSTRSEIIDKLGNKNNLPAQGLLELTGVFFSYGSKKQNILNDINLKISPGQILGVVGVIDSEAQF